MLNYQNFVPGLIAIVILVGIVVLICLGHTIDPELWSAMALVLGFFFGSHASSGQVNGTTK